MLVGEDEQVVEKLLTYASHKPFGAEALSTRARRCVHVLNAHAFDATVELFTIGAIAIRDHVCGRTVFSLVLRTCLDDSQAAPVHDGLGFHNDQDLLPAGRLCHRPYAWCSR